MDGFEAGVGAIDILVNNAGIQHRAPLDEFPAEAFERLLQTNVASVFHVGPGGRAAHDPEGGGAGSSTSPRFRRHSPAQG